jgi:hypothetical protein
LNADRELCEQSYRGSPLMAHERRVIKNVFDVYQEADKYSNERLLPEEVRFTGPTVRRGLLEKAFKEIIEDLGGETIPMHSSRVDSPTVATSHYSLYRLGIYGITISAVADEKHLPRETDYRNSLIAGLEMPFSFAPEQVPDDPYLYTLLQHGRGELDGAIPHYATYKVLDRRRGVVWTRQLFETNAAYVYEIIDAIKPEKESQHEEIVRLRQHLRRRETGDDQT